MLGSAAEVCWIEGGQNRVALIGAPRVRGHVTTFPYNGVQDEGVGEERCITYITGIRGKINITRQGRKSGNCSNSK
jgi:hypothetical protein